VVPVDVTVDLGTASGSVALTLVGSGPGADGDHIQTFKRTVEVTNRCH
jgi:hypothetical protein